MLKQTKTVDLNSDLGESFGAYTIGDDAALIPLISSANVACGFHAGDPVVLTQTIARCKQSGVSVGAHPGHPDLMGFGRRVLQLSNAEAAAYVQYQVAAAQGVCRAQGVALRHVKLHGALYNQAGKDFSLALAVCKAIAQLDKDLVLLALAGSEMVRAANETGLTVREEVFADRAYEPDGSLVARTKPGAMIHDEDLAVRRVVQMVTQGTVEAIDGSVTPLNADSICVHGDNANAIAFVARIRQALTQAGVSIAHL